VSVDLLAEARRRLDAGDPGSAHRLAERALESSRASGARNETAAAAKLVAECLYVIGDIAGARRLLDEALTLSKAIGDPAALGAAYNLWGVLEITVGRAEDAIDLLRRSYDLREQELGADDADTVESLNNLAVALWRSGAEDEAIGLHEEALRRCERALGEDHRRTAETLNALAVKLQSRPESQDRARELYERALVAAEAALGPDSELVARLLTNVAAARIDDDELESAGRLLDRALELHERHFGPMSRWTSYVLTTQGEHASAEGHYDDARRAFERAFVIRVNELGPTDPETLDAAMGLMNTLTEIAGEPRRLGERPSEAAAEAVDLATALQLPLFALHPALAGTFPGGGGPDPVRAAEQLRHVADRLASRTAPDAEQTAATARARELTEEADTAYLSGDLMSAAGRLREAIGLLETARGPMDTSLVELLQRLKLVHRMAGTESEVLPLLRRIATILSAAYGEIHPLAIRAIGEIYWQERREYGPAGASETAARVEALVRDALGEESVVGRLVRAVIAAAREEVPAGAEAEDPPLSARRERILAEPDPLVDELLPDIATTPWASIDHAYDRALDTPRHLRLLLAQDERVRHDALDLLGESLLHQGSVYPATTPAVAVIRRLAADARVPGRARLIGFLGAAAEVARDAAGPDTDQLREALADLPDFLRLVSSSDGDPEVREAAAKVLSELDV
jgi:tetratricopeptide (TPR) repeat protein